MEKRKIIFTNNKTGECRWVFMEEKNTDYFFKKWFKVCKRDGLNVMERFIRNDGSRDYTISTKVPDNLVDFKLKMETL